jgi:hypothetical protein
MLKVKAVIFDHSIGKYYSNALDVVDDADSNRVKNDAKLASGIGEIVVYAYRSRHEKQAGRNRPTRALNGAPSEISEKALKGRALSHGVGYFHPSFPIPHILITIQIRGGKARALPKTVHTHSYRWQAEPDRNLQIQI